MRTKTVLLAGVFAWSAGCHESDVTLDLTEKGTAVLAANVRISSRFVSGGNSLAKISPALAILKDADPLFLKTPDDATRKELEKAGVKVLENVSKRTDTEMSSKFRVQLQRLSALEAFARLRGGDEPKGDVPRGDAPKGDPRSGDAPKGDAQNGDVPKETGLHLPVDAVRLSRDEAGVYTLEGTFPIRASVGIKAGAVKDDLAGFSDALTIGMGLANDVNNFRLSVTMTVPGEIVDFAPKEFGHIPGAPPPGMKKPPGGKVIFDATMSMLPKDYVSKLKGEYIPLVFRVRFKLPKGRSLPADALWDGVPKAPAPAEPPASPPPTTAPPPPTPPPAPTPPPK